MRFPFPIPVRLLAVLLGLSWLSVTPDARAAIALSVTPNTVTMTGGTEFDVQLAIPSTGSAFNGFSVVLQYNPAVLTLLPKTPSVLQEGCLMTGGCSAACGTTFHQFIAAGDSIVVNDYLFCNQTTLTGPGALYTLRFRASNGGASTAISVRRVSFFNAGVLVTPVNVTNSSITITSALGVGDEPGAAHALRIEPNPSFGRLQLVVEDGGTGLTEADIIDLQGRVVRHLGPVWVGPRGRIEWDGTDQGGARAAGGVYLARLRRGGRVETSRFTLLR